MRGWVFGFCFVFPLLMGGAASAEPWESWLSAVRAKALRQGVSAETFDTAFKDFEPLEEVIELDGKQPESTRTFSQYLRGTVSQARIEEGGELFRHHRSLLEKIGERYGVPPQVIVALWGMETNYGENTGGTPVIDALATLAYEGRRREFFEKELLQALQILERGDVSLARFEGSWAGAMGQCQFMPSSYADYAIDYDRDGKRDIWHTLPDVFASIANYLSEHGWDATLPWGIEVEIPVALSKRPDDFTAPRRLSEWQTLGIRLPETAPERRLEAAPLQLVVPERLAHRGYLVTPNFKVLMQWNRSRYFATSVGLLSDAVREE